MNKQSRIFKNIFNIVILYLLQIGNVFADRFETDDCKYTDDCGSYSFSSFLVGMAVFAGLVYLRKDQIKFWEFCVYMLIGAFTMFLLK
ncbi:hypothetical protein VSPL_29070 [Vibrio splendidus]|nr:hypothetical protein VSPL_29070 [Vibrio splendidus]